MEIPYVGLIGGGCLIIMSPLTSSLARSVRRDPARLLMILHVRLRARGPGIPHDHHDHHDHRVRL